MQNKPPPPRRLGGGGLAVSEVFKGFAAAAEARGRVHGSSARHQR